MEQKRYMNIDRVKSGDGIGGDNIRGFEVGDIIQISEKLDGSNAGIRYDAENGRLEAYSRNKVLDEENKLEGFWNYVQKLDADKFKDTPNYVIFGEWAVPHAVRYNPEVYGKWYVYDIYDVEEKKYLPQTVVKKFAEEHGLIYIHVLYEGGFISWEHCMSFCNSPAYGDMQEGIVIKNQSKLNDPNSRRPFVLKIVNECFAEVNKRYNKPKPVNTERLKEIEQAQGIVDMIVTANRIEKELYKLRDEGIIPGKITKEDMKTLAHTLPGRIYRDCVKEEKEHVEAAGKYFGQLCGTKVMKLAKEILAASEQFTVEA